jgi:hypothetical protein
MAGKKEQSRLKAFLFNLTFFRIEVVSKLLIGFKVPRYSPA